nr:hypothetical protein Iba_chr11aCG15870 [Ipomoea batatas]GMD52838.1 hypothetical protein Iba_chr11bCG15440 [Ipomoea batatas]GMD54584.1 hypothetical protein Iba_chr11cCG13550 [Ipomoea batatas]GMD72117.1 hypothetical protein Iba_scaffold1525723CG0010 [Ipomoea batatas]
MDMSWIQIKSYLVLVLPTFVVHSSHHTLQQALFLGLL